MRVFPTIWCLFLTSASAFVIPQQNSLRHASSQLFSGQGFGSTPPPKQQKKPQYNEESNRTVERPQEEGELNQGQVALQEMRRQRAEQRDEELRKVREIKQTDAYLKETPAVIPEKVANRMGRRMLPFVGIPLFGGMGAFVGFWYLATYQNMEFQPSLVAYTTIGILVVGLLVCL